MTASAATSPAQTDRTTMCAMCQPVMVPVVADAALLRGWVYDVTSTHLPEAYAFPSRWLRFVAGRRARLMHPRELQRRRWLNGGPPDGGPLVESPSRYQECVLGTSCPGPEEVCFAIRANGTETAWCTVRCETSADCPGGALCLTASGTVDPGLRCHEGCSVDADCNAPGFGCYRVGIMSSRGMYEADLCYPNAR